MLLMVYSSYHYKVFTTPAAPLGISISSRDVMNVDTHARFFRIYISVYIYIHTPRDV